MNAGYFVRIEGPGGILSGYSRWCQSPEVAVQVLCYMRRRLAYWLLTGQADASERVVLRRGRTLTEVPL